MHDYEASLEHDKRQTERVAFLLENLSGGGAERVMLDLAEGFSALGYDVDLLVCEARGVLLDSIPSSINTCKGRALVFFCQPCQNRILQPYWHRLGLA